MHREPQTGLGRAVRSLRQKIGLDQEALAERADVSAALIADVEGGMTDPTWGDMRRIAKALGVSLERLAELAEELEAD